MFATGADNGVLSLLLRKSQIVLAGGAFSVNVGFFVSLLAFLQIKKFHRLFNKLQKFQVFLLPFIDVFGKCAEGCIAENCQL